MGTIACDYNNTTTKIQLLASFRTSCWGQLRKGIIVRCYTFRSVVWIQLPATTLAIPVFINVGCALPQAMISLVAGALVPKIWEFRMNIHCLRCAVSKQLQVTIITLLLSSSVEGMLLAIIALLFITRVWMQPQAMKIALPVNWVQHRLPTL